MSYNLLLDTGFKKVNKHWKLTNCEYSNGYLIGKDKIYSIEQEIVLPNPTKLYFGLEYICFSKDIKKIYCGIQINDILEINVKEPALRRRKRISVVDNSKEAEKIKVKFIIEAKTDNTKIYIDSPLLLDLIYHNKDWWLRWMLNKALDYRYGYDYENLYNKGSEIKIDNLDFTSAYTETESAKTGIIAHVIKDDSFIIQGDIKPNRYYLLKLDYEQINKYGNIYCKYGETISTPIDDEQLYMVFKGDNLNHKLHLFMKNDLELPYLINFKRLLLIDITDLRIDEDDIIHLPFI